MPELVRATAEQERARDAFVTGRDLAVVAGAGTGKTATLMLMAAAARGRGLYLAFNRATADDARGRFGPNVRCRTAHSLAYGAVGRKYRDRLDACARIPGTEVARILGIRSPIGVGQAAIGEAHQARLAMGMIRGFCFSGDAEPMARHMEPVNGLAPAEADYLAGHLVRFALRAWDDIRAPSGRLRFEHDHYLKIWALADPVLPADFLMLDEAQDTNPVLEKIFLAQSAQRVCVGDPAQQIYAWRAARDVLTGFAGDHVRLTRSFRFGPAIAEVANRWLEHAESDMRLAGAGPIASRVAAAKDADAVLCRGNADVMREVLAFLDAGTRVAITGGGGALRRIAEAALELKAGKRTSHPELFLFPDWGSVQEYAEHDAAAQDLKTLVALVDACGAETVISAVSRLAPEESAEVTVSTAHKAKGREWASVRIGSGFGPPQPGDDGTPRLLSPDEARLIYVAVTRARQRLDIEGLGWAQEYENAVRRGRARTPLADLPLAVQLRYAAAPATRFLVDRLPGADRVVREYRALIGSLPPAVRPTGVRSPAWAVLGFAIGFRLRLSLGRIPGRSVAAAAAAFGGGRAVPGAPASARDAAFRCGRELLAAVEAGRHGQAAEEDLARLCFVAASYEDVYRSGQVRRDSLLAQVTAVTRLADLLRRVPDYAIADIEAQMALSGSVFSEFRSLPESAAKCGVAFAGSADIGGADADFVIDGLLLDCDATTDPRQLGAGEIYQLAGRLLLDYHDEFGIRSVGVYLSRYGFAVKWDILRLMSLMGARTSVPELRAGLRSYLRAWRAHSE